MLLSSRNGWLLQKLSRILKNERHEAMADGEILIQSTWSIRTRQISRTSLAVIAKNADASTWSSIVKDFTTARKVYHEVFEFPLRMLRALSKLQPLRERSLSHALIMTGRNTWRCRTAGLLIQGCFCWANYRGSYNDWTYLPMAQFDVHSWADPWSSERGFLLTRADRLLLILLPALRVTDE